MIGKNVQEKSIEIKTKPNINLDGIVCFLAFLLCIIFLIYININGDKNNNLKYLNLLVIITALVLLVFSMDKMNLIRRIYVRFIGKEIIIYPRMLCDKTIINAEDIKKVINMDDKILLILSYDKNYISIIKKNMCLKDQKDFIYKLSKYSRVENKGCLKNIFY
ncbi:hypothetical protein [Haloimpatiens lingqiaonensis]|uniref:hypothetical protein n=1 Tax=Haloimpatiens lingqiaonensis TaxID=1380675 RepID=UPI0010FEB9C7|nr:hypothetical protein [Haloimpatiens lingqiaonensis]